MKVIYSICFIFIVAKSTATTYFVGPTQTYTSPNALYLSNAVNHGDTILIDFAEYTGSATLANWSKDDLVIVGIGGRPHLKATGANIQGKSIWITSGNNITIENIEFSECTVPDKNGAGIRVEGDDLTLRHCYFHHNENGILTNNSFSGHLQIEYCEFAYNGYGDGFSHNLYVGHISKLTFRYNYSHHANIGQNLKSRADENFILYNRIMDETTGNSSRLIDLSNGGFSIIMGNLLMQGQNAENNNMVGYGPEGLSNPNKELYFINNTLVNKRTASCRFLDINNGVTVAQVHNNIFAGTGTIVNGTTTSMSNNFITTTIADLMFLDEPNFDYNLTLSSPCRDTAVILSDVNGYSLMPTHQYLHSTSFDSRPFFAGLDIGAYEYAPDCNSALVSYQFDGTFDTDWQNGQNWDNGCLPPPNFSGDIIINSDCDIDGSSSLDLLPGCNLTVKSGYLLTWNGS